jgi:hypothetical protein
VNERATTDEEHVDERGLPADRPDALRGFDLGLLAALGFALAYALLAYPIGLTFGLVAVGFIGGIVVGAAVTRGAWSNRPHLTLRRLQLMAALIGIGGWMVGLFGSYVISQALLPQASTGLLERLSFADFSAYFAGLDELVRLSHAGAVAAAAFMAWRGAR